MTQSALERLFLFHLSHLAPDLHARAVLEFQFAPPRKWRFDVAWPDVAERVAVEVDGGTWLARGGRHNQDSDREKMNAAAVRGWRVLRFSGDMLRADPVGCVEQVQRALAVPEGAA